MLYADASVLLSQGMKTAKELVDEALLKAGMSPTELGQKLGYKNGFQGYYRIFVSNKIKFTPERQRRVEELLRLPHGHFAAPELTEKRELYVRRTFEQFRKTEIARALDQESLKTLESIPFNGAKLPTVELYQALALAMGGHYSTQQLDAALKLTEEVDREAEPTGTHATIVKRQSRK
jgi:hypothetical protein